MADARPTPEPIPAPTPEPTPEPTLRPAAERGTLEVRAKALQSIAEQAAREVPRTVVRSARLAGLGATASPQARVALSGSTDGPQARIDVDVLGRWPAALSAVAEQVRDHVTTRATALSGIRVTSVDVTVGATTEAGAGARRVT